MPQDFSRYSCQMALPDFNTETQQLFVDAKVLIVGIGGLGCPAAQYLAAMGVGTIGLADGDAVSVSNLHRQILYTPDDTGFQKVNVAKERLEQQNPDVNFITHNVHVDADNITELINNYDIILDCTDNFETRYLLNDACVINKTPLVYGAIYRYEGQVAIWNVKTENGKSSPNYRDLYPDVNTAAVPNCSEGGVIPTIAGIIGCMQANEVVKYLTGSDDLLAGKIMMFDARAMNSHIIKLGDVTRTNITSLPVKNAVIEVTLSDWEQHKEDYELIDVRASEEREQNNIGGTHIPLQELSSNNLPDSNKPLLFYCASGKRSSIAVYKLQDEITDRKMYSLKGGIG